MSESATAVKLQQNVPSTFSVTVQPISLKLCQRNTQSTDPNYCIENSAQFSTVQPIEFNFSNSRNTPQNICKTEVQNMANSPWSLCPLAASSSVLYGLTVTAVWPHSLLLFRLTFSCNVPWSLYPSLWETCAHLAANADFSLEFGPSHT